MRAKNSSEQFKKRWMVSTMCFVSINHWGSIFHKKKAGWTFNFLLKCLWKRYQTQINRHWWKWEKKLVDGYGLTESFFSIHKRLSFHDIYQVVVILFWSYFIEDVLTCENVQLAFFFARFFSVHNSSVSILALWTWYVTSELAVCRRLFCHFCDRFDCFFLMMY